MPQAAEAAGCGTQCPFLCHSDIQHLGGAGVVGDVKPECQMSLALSVGGACPPDLGGAHFEDERRSSG